MDIKDWPVKFQVGQVVYNKQFRYRGVVVDVDPCFQKNDLWYEKLTRNNRTPRDQPWYHLLLDDDGGETYAAERQLEADHTATPVEHPMVERLFGEFQEGIYARKGRLN